MKIRVERFWRIFNRIEENYRGELTNTKKIKQY